MEKHTYQTGIIGNCSYIAHVNVDTNISWLCWPRFDSSFVFGGLLDEVKGGEFSIRPQGEYESKQYYLENTNILCTEVQTSTGKYRITDFAPRFREHERYFKPLMLIRKLEVLDGYPTIKVKCEPTYHYGKIALKRAAGSNHIQFSGGEDEMRLTTNVSLSYILEDRYFVLNSTKYLVLTYGSPLEVPLETVVESFLIRTKQYWRTWIKHSSIGEFYQEYVIRSALALKIHQYEDTGAIIAASTTSLPEFPGSGRNWDYRFCWLRDTYYIINALHHIGHFEETEKYFEYIKDISFESGLRFQPLYSITRKHNLEEYIAEHLSGYLGNGPVRIGNQAFEHIQNDIYGQAIITLLPLYSDHRFVFAERRDSAFLVDIALKRIEFTIDEQDAGIWEFRNSAYVHCYSNLFQWAGCKAAAKIARRIHHKKLEEKALHLMSKAANHIEACYDEERRVYTHAVGSPHLDASTLQLIMMNYLDPASDRAKNHLIALEKELKTPNGLFYRYLHQDDFGKPETTFLICAFWYIEALACVGRLDDAMRQFEKLMEYSNHLKLFSEDVDEVTGSQWGNFPQAYSHVGLMNAAHRIATKLNRPLYL
jgi:GH15 family glucan-1,4-alpha-glucosidase